MKNKLKFNTKIIDEWILCKWGNSNYKIYELNHHILLISNPNANLFEIEEEAFYKIKYTINYIINFNKKLSAQNINCNAVVFAHNYKYIYRCNDPYWITIHKNKSLSQKIQKLDKNRNLINSMDFKEFEMFCAKTFNNHNYKCTTTNGSKDGGLDFYGVKNTKNSSIDNIDNRYVFGQCKRYSQKISTNTIKAWLYDVNQFRNKKGYAYDVIWPYKNDKQSIYNTTFYFCTTASIEYGGMEALKDNNIKLLTLDYLALQ
tara:strand:- start:942 stop:1718 length:777 start_codon:yes stop_codon:yes gene_type:complete